MDSENDGEGLVDPMVALDGIDHLIRDIFELVGPSAVAASYNVSRSWRKALERTVDGPR